MRTRLSSHLRQDGASGAIATEFVVVLPLFLIFLLGILSVGSAYFQQLRFTEAAREGARYGATLRTNDISGEPDADWLTQIAEVATATAGQWEHVCVTYTGLWARSQTGGQGTYTYRQDSGQAPVINASGSGTPCMDDGLTSTDRRVQVIVTGTGSFNVFLFQTDLQLDGEFVSPFQNLRTTTGG